MQGHLWERQFRLAYGSEAVILAEVGLTSYKVENYDKSKNDEAIRLQLNLMDEVRATAKQRYAKAVIHSNSFLSILLGCIDMPKMARYLCPN